MTERRTRWLQSMIEHYGSEEAVSLEMKRRQQKSMQNPNRQKGQHHGGFNNKELAKSAGERGRQTRWGTGSTGSRPD